jgi:hypothetical protein
MIPEEHKVDRKGWDAGPWDNEPDYISWTDAETGMPCLIVRNRLGALCGYVAVERAHPLYGVEYEAPEVDVHGGLTYADRCTGHICHVPEPGKPDDVWWFGFDCSHAFDLSPGMNARMRDIGEPNMSDETYKPVSYVTAQCASLARQLAEKSSTRKEESS